MLRKIFLLISLHNVLRDIAERQPKAITIVFGWQLRVHEACQLCTCLWWKVTEVNSDQISLLLRYLFREHCEICALSNRIIIDLLSFLALFHDGFHWIDLAIFVCELNEYLRKGKLNVHREVEHCLEWCVDWFVEVSLHHGDASKSRVTNLHVKHNWFKWNLLLCFLVYKVGARTNIFLLFIHLIENASNLL